MGQIIGIYGTGYANAQEARDLLEAVIDEETKFIFAITERLWTPTLAVCLEFIADLVGLDYEVVVDETADKIKEASEYITGASRVYKVQRIPHKVVNLLSKQDDAALFFLWEDEDDDCRLCLEKADDKGIVCFDLTNNLEPVEFTDSPDHEPTITLDQIIKVKRPQAEADWPKNTDEPGEEEEWDGTMVMLSRDDLQDMLNEAMLKAIQLYRQANGSEGPST